MLIQRLKPKRVIKRDDLHKHFYTPSPASDGRISVPHVQEIIAFAEQYGLTFGDAANTISPPTADHPNDATLEILTYLGVQYVDTDVLAASTCEEAFGRAYEPTVAFLQNMFMNNVSRGIGRNAQVSQYHQIADIVQQQFAQNNPGTREGLTRAWNPTTQGMVETNRKYRPRVRIADVIAIRYTITGNKLEIPTIDTPEDFEITIVPEGGDLPEETMMSGEKFERTQKTGYVLRITYEMRNSNSPISMPAEHQRVRARQVENAIVNWLLNTIAGQSHLSATPTGSYAWSATPTDADIVETHLSLEDDYVFDRVVGQLEFIVKYAVHEIFYTNDGETKPGMPRRRNFLDEILGVEVIAKKKVADVPNMGVTGKTSSIWWDHMNTIDYITERGGNINEMDRNIGNQVLRISNSVRFGSNMRYDAPQCSQKVTIG